MTRPVRIAATGALSGCGDGPAALATALREGRCNAEPADDIGFPGEQAPYAVRFPRAIRDRYGPGEAAARGALFDTVDQCLAAWGQRDRLAQADTGLFCGTGGWLYASAAELYWRATVDVPRSEPFRVRDPEWGAALLADRHALEGPTLTLSTGCASSANALLAAAESIDRGEIARALVVGAEGLSPVSLSGFDALMLLDPLGCRPFDRDRAGLRLGEAVGVLAVEPDDGRSPGLVLRGGANRCDTHHLTSASPDGAVMRDVMRAALADAGAMPADIVAVKAHATGSVDSDRAEASALRAVFGPDLPPITALKPVLGHTLGACGAIETVAMAACLAQGFIPGTAGFAVIDDECGVMPLAQPMPARAGLHLLHFFGFGGNYTALVVEWRP
jgi:3-oxoacyl-(acyl-carrier-protein) synthase